MTTVTMKEKTIAAKTTKEDTTMHYGTKPGHFETLNHTLSHERGSERSEPASERVSGASERANEQTDERVTQYLPLDSWLYSGPF